jgi:4-hydroxybenzoate polyprenyltransferase
MLVYYKTFSIKVFLMALFLFFILLIIDIIKDILTKNADKMFGYSTIPNRFRNSTPQAIIVFLSIILMLNSMLIISETGIHDILNLYFAFGLFITIFVIYLILNAEKKFNFFALNILRIWVFLGICAMLLDGIMERF